MYADSESTAGYVFLAGKTYDGALFGVTVFLKTSKGS